MEISSSNRGEKASISIILPTYNVEKYIGQCLDTIFTQTWPNIECIIVDDCCTDRSIGIAEEKIKSYKAGGGHIEFKIVWHGKNRGAAAARNTGMDAASGDYLWWVDPDDYIAEDAVFDLLHGLGDERPDIIAFGSGEFVDGAPIKYYKYCPPLGYTTVSQMLHSIFSDKEGGFLWRKLFSRQFVTKNNLRSTEGIPLGNDFEFYVNMYNVDAAIIKNDYHCCYYYRMSRAGSTQNKAKDAVSCLCIANRDIEKAEILSGSKRKLMTQAAARRVVMAFNIIVQGKALDMKASCSYFKKHIKAYRKVLQESSLPTAVRLADRLRYPFCLVLARYRSADKLVFLLKTFGIRKI